MTLDQFGSLFNLIGLLVPLVFSLAIARAYKRPFFLHWTRSLALLAAAVLIFTLIGPQSPSWGLSAVLVGLYQAGVWFFIRTAETIRPQGPTPRAWRWAWGAMVLTSWGPLLAGQPLVVALLSPILLLVAVHFLLAWELWRIRHGGARWLSLFVALTGIWTLIFPALGTAPFAWAGFVFSGALHLVVGMQMVIHLLEDTAMTLRTQNEQLQQLDRLKSDFIGTVSHELRTPLSSIKSATWLLQNHRANVKEDELIGIVASQAEVLQRLVNDLLDFAKIESGSLSYDHQPLEMVALARSVVHDATPRFAQKGVELSLEAASEDVELEGDPDRLAQVTDNLLSNALKFTEPGGSVTVRVSRAEGQARLVVEDTGVGIPAGERQRIFERFYQIDNSSTRRVGGAGLGLSICKAIVEEGHGGRIWVEQGPRGGSRFIVALPLDAEPTNHHVAATGS